jgi:transcriptional regulator with XRE-family HTH domain
MNTTDPLSRLLPAFGAVLVRARARRAWTVDSFAAAADLSPAEIAGMEHGEHGPTLLEFFQIARALGEEPTLLLVDVVAAWRADPAGSHESRPADFVRLYRLGYHHRPADFRELSTPYHSVAEATHAAGTLNAQRHTRGVALLDTVCMYVRLSYVSLRPDGAQVGGGTTP